MGQFLERTPFPVYKIPIKKPAILDGLGDMSGYTKDSLLFDLEIDEGQTSPLQDDELEDRMKHLLVEEMKKLEAPEEQFERLDLLDIL